MLPVTVFILAVCWHPKVQTSIVRSQDGSYCARWRALTFYTLLKNLVLLAGLCAIMIVRLQSHGFLDGAFWAAVGRGFSACSESELLIPILTNVLTGVVAHLLFFVSAHLCVTGQGVVIPSVVSTLVAVAVVISSCVREQLYLTSEQCGVNEASVWIAVALAYIIWVSPYFLKGLKFSRSSDIILKPYSELFINPTWDGLFLDQHNTLNCTPHGFTDTKFIFEVVQRKIIPKVFVCTTMYKEERWEMVRVLKSFRRLIDSDYLCKRIDLECHIYLDQGAKDRHYSEFSTQLVSLLEKNLVMSLSDVDRYETAYGIQMRWSLRSAVGKDVPCFIHMKDPKKIKSKKRWSQAMYLHYVLDYKVPPVVAPPFKAAVEKSKRKKRVMHMPGLSTVRSVDRINEVDSHWEGLSDPVDWNDVPLVEDPETQDSVSVDPSVCDSARIQQLESVYREVTEGGYANTKANLPQLGEQQQQQNSQSYA